MISANVSKNADLTGRLKYQTDIGLFALFDENGNVRLAYRCREQYHSSATLSNSVLGFYSSGGLNIESINHFFEEYIESKLGIENSVTFHLSTIENLIVVELGEFWTKNLVRYNIFTLLLRNAAIFNRNTLDESLEAYDLAKQVKGAINYFLEGNTTPRFTAWCDGANGFVSQFKNRSSKELAEKLSFLEVKKGEYFANV